MPFQVVWPLVQRVDGDSFKQAVKNFVKMNRKLNIEKIIITDQMRHMQATFDYFKHDIRNRVGINIFKPDPLFLRSVGIAPLVVSNPLVPASNLVVRSRNNTTSLVSPTLLRPSSGLRVGNMVVNNRGVVAPVAPAVVTSPVAPVFTPTGPLRGDGVDVGPIVGNAVPLSGVGVVRNTAPVITSRQAPGIVATPRTVVVGNDALGPLRLRRNVSPIPMGFSRVANLN